MQDEVDGAGGRLLLVDNFDSYTFNLYQYIAVVCGEAPAVIKNTDERGADADFLRGFAGVVISPGPGSPEHPADIGVVPRLCELFDGPVLGVCLGFQAMGFWEGVPVVRVPRVIHGEVSPVYHSGDDKLLHRIPSPFKSVRYHSLALQPGALARCGSLEMIGASVEAEGAGFGWPEASPPWLPQAAAVIPMVLRHVSKARWGVQYHPESVCSQYGMQLMANFADICGICDSGWAMAAAEAAAWAPSRGLGRAGGSELHCVEVPLAEGMDAADASLRAFHAVFRSSGTACWLDSCTDARGKWSFAADASASDGFTLSHTVHDSHTTVTGPGAAAFDDRAPAGACEGVLDRMAAFLKRCGDSGNAADACADFPFRGGFVGYIGYEMRRESLLAAHGEAAVRGCDLGPMSTHGGLPDLHFVWASRFLAFDHRRRKMWVCETGPSGPIPEWAAATRRVLADLPPVQAEAEPASSGAPLLFRPSAAKEQYLAAIRESQIEIQSGETYEVCLTNEFELVAEPPADPLQFYAALRRANPAPYSAFIRVPGFGAVCSTSPERFLSVGSGGDIEAKPIKGTLRRDLKCPDNDARLRDELRQSKKDQCENLMIADLLRNDLGMVCEAGSVRVPPGKLMDIESFKTVHQMVTTVQGQLPRATPTSRAVTALDLVRISFPGGSITGAPKVRTMEIIQRLERRRRGMYTGSVGYFSVDGAADLSIVIRTAAIGTTAEGPRLRVGAGGAITALSDPEGEWDEIMLKARPLLDAVSRSLAGPSASWELAS